MSAEATRTRALVYVCAYRHHGGPIDVAASMERLNPGFLDSGPIRKSRDLIAPHLFAETRNLTIGRNLLNKGCDSANMMNTTMMSGQDLKTCRHRSRHVG
jgi:hypothetical protein